MKEFLRRKQIQFVEKDVAASEEALDELSRLGWMTTPVTIVNGEVVVGFDVKKLEELLR